LLKHLPSKPGDHFMLGAESSPHSTTVTPGQMDENLVAKYVPVCWGGGGGLHLLSRYVHPRGVGYVAGKSTDPDAVRSSCPESPAESPHLP